ncbi:MAG: flagellar hook capping protein [Planctomycetaceae bacterium]|nr:flagellar hook capping protein [Planctomycetaceae bacterium]
MTEAFNAALGQQQFLELFVTQLQYQDPLEPVEQQDFLAQLAQFSTVEGLENLNTKFDDLLQLELVASGTEVLGQEITTDDNLTGIAQAIRQEDGQVLVDVDGTLVPLSGIVTVRNPPAPVADASGTGT